MHFTTSLSPWFSTSLSRLGAANSALAPPSSSASTAAPVANPARAGAARRASPRSAPRYSNRAASHAPLDGPGAGLAVEMRHRKTGRHRIDQDAARPQLDRRRLSVERRLRGRITRAENARYGKAGSRLVASEQTSATPSDRPGPAACRPYRPSQAQHVARRAAMPMKRRRKPGPPGSSSACSRGDPSRLPGTARAEARPVRPRASRRPFRRRSTVPPTTHAHVRPRAAPRCTRSAARSRRERGRSPRSLGGAVEAQVVALIGVPGGESQDHALRQRKRPHGPLAASWPFPNRHRRAARRISVRSRRAAPGQPARADGCVPALCQRSARGPLRR